MSSDGGRPTRTALILSFRQTGDTFLAAATFLELCQMWGDMDPEIAGRIKFAKYHAIRITKAVKAGEDPNASNPVAKEDEEEEAQVESSDIQAFDALVAEQAARPRQASVEEIPDESDRLGRQMAHQSSLDESLHPSRTSSLPPIGYNTRHSFGSPKCTWFPATENGRR